MHDRIGGRCCSLRRLRVTKLALLTQVLILLCRMLSERLRRQRLSLRLYLRRQMILCAWPRLRMCHILLLLLLLRVRRHDSSLLMEPLSPCGLLLLMVVRLHLRLRCCHRCSSRFPLLCLALLLQEKLLLLLLLHLLLQA